MPGRIGFFYNVAQVSGASDLIEVVDSTGVDTGVAINDPGETIAVTDSNGVDLGVTL